MTEKKTLYLIDGYNIIFRAYHSLPPLTRSSDNLEVGALYGFINILYRIYSEKQYSHILIAFDSQKKTFRKEIFPEYKATRTEAPPELKHQFNMIKTATKILNIKSIEIEGFEADDIIASYSIVAAEQDFNKIVIISTDKDFYQLINDRISCLDIFKNKELNENEIFNKYGIYPENMLDYLSLIGDSADNVPGVPSIGPKTAVKLLNTHKSIDNLISYLKNLSKTEPKKLDKKSQAILNNIDLLLLSKKLIKLEKNIDIDNNFDILYHQEIDAIKFIEFLNQNDFFSIKKRFLNTVSPSILSEVKKLGIDKNITKLAKKKINSITSNDNDINIITNNINKNLNNPAKTIKNLEELNNLEIALLKLQKISINYRNYEAKIEKLNKHIITISIENNSFLIIVAEDYKKINKTNQPNQPLLDGTITNELTDNNKEISIINVKDFLRKILKDNSVKKIIFNLKALLKFTDQ